MGSGCFVIKVSVEQRMITFINDKAEGSAATATLIRQLVGDRGSRSASFKLAFC